MTIRHRSIAGHLRRWMAVMMALFAASTVMSIPQVAAAQQQTRAITVDDACIDVPDQGFTDVLSSNVHADMIDCLASFGITKGTGDGTTYEPGATVRRWEMALFLERVLEVVSGSLPETQEAMPFDDVEKLNPDAQDAIHLLAELDVAKGRTPRSFDPFSFVRRDQMASFINRLQDVLSDLYTEDGDFFTDDEGNVHEGHINALAAVGIVEGVGGSEYHPGRSVTRAQMASFLMRHIEENIDAGRLDVIDFVARQDFDVTPVAAATKSVSAGDDNTGARQYVVNVGDETSVDIRLLPAGLIAVDQGGRVTFADGNGDDEADLEGEVLAHLEVVNGIASADGSHADAVAPLDGVVSFTIDSTQPDEVVPVIWADDDNDDLITLDNGRPTEPFGIGGQTTWIRPSSTITGATVQADEGLPGVATYNDVWQLEFSRTIAPSTIDGGQFLLEDGDGDVILVECGRDVNTSDDYTSAICSSGVDAGDNMLAMNIVETPEDRNAGAGNDVISYPLTIMSTNADVADIDGYPVDVDASADVLIGSA